MISLFIPYFGWQLFPRLGHIFIFPFSRDFSEVIEDGCEEHTRTWRSDAGPC